MDLAKNLMNTLKRNALKVVLAAIPFALVLGAIWIYLMMNSEVDDTSEENLENLELLRAVEVILQGLQARP